MENNEKTTAKVIGEFIGSVIAIFIKALFIYVGLGILRNYGIAIPMFTYWEVLLLRIALGNIYPNYKFNKN